MVRRDTNKIAHYSHRIAVKRSEESFMEMPEMLMDIGLLETPNNPWEDKEEPKLGMRKSKYKKYFPAIPEEAKKTYWKGFK
jgi:hypothetical protein